MPKRPLSAYNLFFRKKRRELLGDDAKDFEIEDQAKRKHRKSHGKIGFAEMAKKIGQEWKSLDRTEKEVFEEDARSRKEAYKKAMKAYKSSLAKEQDDGSKPNAVKKGKKKETAKSDRKNPPTDGTSIRRSPSSPRTDSAQVLATLGSTLPATVTDTSQRTIVGQPTAPPPPLQYLSPEGIYPSRSDTSQRTIIGKPTAPPPSLQYLSPEGVYPSRSNVAYLYQQPEGHLGDVPFTPNLAPPGPRPDVEVTRAALTASLTSLPFRRQQQNPGPMAPQPTVLYPLQNGQHPTVASTLHGTGTLHYAPQGSYQHPVHPPPTHVLQHPQPQMVVQAQLVQSPPRAASHQPWMHGAADIYPQWAPPAEQQHRPLTEEEYYMLHRQHQEQQDQRNR